jgi:two-component system LytT family response regulator
MTEMITAIIVDDEMHNRNVLKILLSKHCPNIKIIEESDSADAAYRKINELKPQLVFLDIKMPEKSGFDLLKMFTEIRFEVIFVSAFNEYAVNAFEFNVLDYILKPIDYFKLIKAVTKASQKIATNTGSGGILHFIKTLDEKNDLINKFSLHHNGKVVLVNVSEISFIEAKKDFCRVNLFDNTHYTSSKDLKMFENVLQQAGNFIRINKSVIINTDFLKSYTKGEVCIIELKTLQAFEVSRRKKSEIIGKIKSTMS